jgi:hypothetical protein
VQQAHQAASVADGLLVPDDLFPRAAALVLWAVFVFLDAELLICLVHRKYQQEGMGGAWHKGEQLGLVDAENIVEGEPCAETQLVHECVHDLGVVLWRAVSRAP